MTCCLTQSPYFWAQFSEQNEALVVEMTWEFLDYVKSAQLDATDTEIADWRKAELEEVELWMTTNGFPIIPKLVMEKELKKNEWEKLLRAFLTQHYCELWLTLHFKQRSDSECIFFRSSQWTEVKTGTLQGIEDGYWKLHSGQISSIWNNSARPKKHASQ